MGLPEAAEHVQKGIPHPVTAGGLLHGDVVDVALVQHHLETGVAQHAALPVLGDNEAGLGVKERVREHVLAQGVEKHSCSSAAIWGIWPRSMGTMMYSIGSSCSPGVTGRCHIIIYQRQAFCKGRRGAFQEDRRRKARQSSMIGAAGRREGPGSHAH